ncbi:RES domain-containing protein [Vibrio fluvialis]
MKLYRSIEFSRLTFLIDEEHKNFWNELDQKANNGVKYSNWWLEENRSKERHQIIKNVVSNNYQFFNKSADFNSKVGGRFNPSKSFGAIYTSSCPTLSMLEVLYHVFDSSLGLYKNLKKSSDKLTSSFNVPVPEQIKVMITAMELDVNDDMKIYKLCENRNVLKDFCKSLGFYRYIDGGFNEDFLFGNDYEITHIMGCYFHNSGDISLGVPSARVDMIHQNNGHYNVIIPESIIDNLHPELTGRFREYICTMDMNEVDEKHKITITAMGETTKSKTVFLQNKPSRRNNRIIEFSQVDDTGDNRKRYSREVHLQRFVQ